MTSAIATPKRTPARLASGLLALGLTGCVSFVEIPVETPLAPKLDVTRFKRLLVAGFVVERSDDIDLEAEMVRLLQNHLRRNGKMRVLEPDHPPLEDALAELAARDEGDRQAGEAGDEERRLATERVLQDAELWRRLGEEYQQPLIISGRIGFESRDRSGFESDAPVTGDPGGLLYGASEQHYAERRGYTLTADFHFVDGRSGQTLHKERFTEEVLYSAEHKVSPLSAYFELMDRVLPNVTGVISTQRIRGTRVLLL
jgi:hypothetical protein